MTKYDSIYMRDCTFKIRLKKFNKPVKIKADTSSTSFYFSSIDSIKNKHYDKNIKKVLSVIGQPQISM